MSNSDHHSILQIHADNNNNNNNRRNLGEWRQIMEEEPQDASNNNDTFNDSNTNNNRDSKTNNNNNAGPIRRRINSFTITLEPLSQGLTYAEAVNVRNTIESVLQEYFFAVQPWAVTTENGSSNDWQGDDDFGGAIRNGSESGRTSTATLQQRDNKNLVPVAEGSVTYVGLAQILENRRTELGVELTMNGLVYFVEGSTNIPDETELLQTMLEQDALGNSDTVVEALKAFFPSLQLVTIDVAIDVASDSSSSSVSTSTTNAGTDSTTVSGTEIVATQPVVAVDGETATATTLPPRTPEQTETREKTKVMAVTGEEALVPTSNNNLAALAGGVTAGMVVAALVLGMFFLALQRRRRRGKGGRNGVNDRDSGNEYLVRLDDTEKGRGLSEGDWNANSISNMPAATNDVVLATTATTTSKEEESSRHRSSDDGDNNDGDARVETPRVGRSINTNVNASDTSATEDSSPGSDAYISPPNALSYISSFFQRATSNSSNSTEHKQQRQHQRLDSTSSASSSRTERRNINDTMYDFDGDGTLSDFDDAVSIQPHRVPLQSLESFEEQHKGMTRHDLVVQKDQLESSFEKRLTNTGRSAMTMHMTMMSNTPTGTSTESNLSYSSSSVSSREQSRSFQAAGIIPSQSQGVPGTLTVHKTKRKEMEDERERERAEYESQQHQQQRVPQRYSNPAMLLPNPYIRRRSVPVGPNTNTAPKDRSAPCVLTPTEITAASLAHRKASSDTGTSGLDMIPKIVPPAWWSAIVSSPSNNSNESSGNGSGSSATEQYRGRKERRSSAAAAAGVYNDDLDFDDLNYSGDEENTFGKATSDGWDPADTELSSAGDASSKADIDMVMFHPRVGNQAGQSILHNSVRKESVKLQRKRLSSKNQNNNSNNTYDIERHRSYSFSDDSSSDEENNVLKFDGSTDMEI